MLSKSLQLGFVAPKARPNGSVLFARLKRWLGIVPIDPPREFAETLELRRPAPHSVSECPMCGNEVMECDCLWSAQG